MTVASRAIYDLVIDEDLDIPYRDSGTWRSYQLMTHGNTLQELLDNADVVEMDRDGDMIDWYHMDEGPGDIEEAGINLINLTWRSRDV